MKSVYGSACALARATRPCVRSVFEIEALEGRRLLAAAAAIDPTFGGGSGAAARRPASQAAVLNTYQNLTPAGNGQFYAVAYDGGACFPSGYTAFQLLRVNADGSLDTSFGNGGGVFVQRYDPTTLPWGPHFDYDSLLVGGVFAQADGKVLVSFRAVPPGSPDPWVLMRFNADGSTDTGFGNGGSVEMPVPDKSQGVPTTWLRADGKIDVVNADDWHDDGAADNVLVHQFNADGTPDESFGVDGVSQSSFSLTATFPPPTAEQQAVDAGWIEPSHTPGTTTWGTTLDGGAATADGGSVLYLDEGAQASASYDGTTTTYDVDRRVLAVTLDAQGNVTGSATAYADAVTGDSPWSYGLSVTVQPDGKGIVAANTAAGTILSRVNADGSTDATFNAAPLNLPDGVAVVTGSVWVQPDGKLVVVVADGSHDLTGLTRLNADGSTDATFAGGQVIYGFGDGAVIGGALTNADGSVVVSTDDDVMHWYGDYGRDPAAPAPVGARFVRLTPDGGTPGAFDDTGAEAAIKAAIAQKAAAAIAAQAAQAAEWAAKEAAAEAAAAAANVDVGDESTTDDTYVDDGSDAITTDDGNADDLGTYDDSTDPAAYAYDDGAGDSSTDGTGDFFAASDGATVWNPDGTPTVV